MIGEKIKQLRSKANMPQAELARKLDVTRSSVNAWEIGLSSPTTQYIVALSKVFHVSADYLLGLDAELKLVLDSYTQEETEIIYKLLGYFDANHVEK